ncbi:MAG: threonine synthase [Candidatus Handelsmanbacteria bacterium]|nr:threonine synthase [Candidatus Handelsmanbacteria bacterium]
MFHCPGCGARHAWGLRAHQCPTCAGPLDFALEEVAFPREAILSGPPGMWRYAEALPRFEQPVSLGETFTPLVPCSIGETEVWCKVETTLPTGSYKDRGSALLMSYLKELGVEEAVEDSSGNAGASLAAYAARAGVRLKVFCPGSASSGKLLQIRLYGAELVQVEGPRPRATEALLAYEARTKTPYASHLWHPFFLEGVKTLAFEMVEQLEWQAPGTVLCPVGAGSILLGLHKGFSELRRAGVIPRLPRLVAVQARNVSPLHRAFHQGEEDVARAPDPQPTLAEGIALPMPVRGKALLRALRESGGTVVAVSEEEIAAGVRHFGRAGFCVEPTSAVVWAGVARLDRETGWDGPAVAVLSGHGLKASQAIISLL